MGTRLQQHAVGHQLDEVERPCQGYYLTWVTYVPSCNCDECSVGVVLLRSHFADNARVTDVFLLGKGGVIIFDDFCLFPSLIVSLFLCLPFQYPGTDPRARVHRRRPTCCCTLYGITAGRIPGSVPFLHPGQARLRALEGTGCTTSQETCVDTCVAWRSYVGGGIPSPPPCAGPLTWGQLSG